MCVVSMISDHYMRQWPQRQFDHVPPHDYLNYQELLRKARLYDEMTKQPDCPDPKKLDWQKALDQYMKEKYGLEPK